jgi:hypothetical protein
MATQLAELPEWGLSSVHDEFPNPSGGPASEIMPYIIRPFSV